MSWINTENAGGENTGSHQPGEPVFIVVGKLRRPHGLRGEIVFEVITDFPERIHVGQILYVGNDYRPLRLAGLRPHKNTLLFRFEEIGTLDVAGEFRNHLVYVRIEDIPDLPEGEYYHHQLLKMKAVSREGEILGRVVDIIETGSNDVLVVQAEIGSDLLLPLIDEVIQEIDLDAGIIRVNLLPGLRQD